VPGYSGFSEKARKFSARISWNESERENMYLQCFNVCAILKK